MPTLFKDLRFGVRMLAASPGFTAAAIICLALGIGATSAIFSVVHAVLLRPLGYREPDRLVRLYTEFPKFPNGGLRRFWTSPPEYLELAHDLESWEVARRVGGRRREPGGCGKSDSRHQRGSLPADCLIYSAYRLNLAATSRPRTTSKVRRPLR